MVWFVCYSLVLRRESGVLYSLPVPEWGGGGSLCLPDLLGGGGGGGALAKNVPLAVVERVLLCAALGLYS